MLVRFSQKWTKEKYEKLIREAIRFVKGSRSCKDLLVKVFFYRKSQPLSKIAHGNYRNVWIHGYYRSDFPNGRPEYVNGVITLKLAEKIACDPKIEPEGRSFHVIIKDRLMENVIGIFAHEFKHHLDMRKLRSKEKWRHWEVRANKFSEKMLEKFRKGDAYHTFPLFE